MQTHAFVMRNKNTKKIIRTTPVLGKDTVIKAFFPTEELTKSDVYELMRNVGADEGKRIAVEYIVSDYITVEMKAGYIPSVGNIICVIESKEVKWE